jgi:hypothetical protein
MESNSGRNVDFNGAQGDETGAGGTVSLILVMVRKGHILCTPSIVKNVQEEKREDGVDGR